MEKRAYKKQPPYTCPRCGYETRNITSIKFHLQRKRPCLAKCSDIEITDAVCDEVVKFRIYGEHSKDERGPRPMSDTQPQTINIVQKNYIQVINTMDPIEKLCRYLQYKNKSMMNFYDYVEGKFTSQAEGLKDSRNVVTISKENIIETIDAVSNMRALETGTKKPNFTALNVFYDKDSDKINIHDNETWQEYNPIRGVQEIMHVLQAVYLEKYECYLIRKIRNHNDSIRHRQKARESLNEYYGVIAAIDKKPYIYERCDSEILYDPSDDKFGQGLERYTIVDEFMPLYEKAKKSIKKKDTNDIVKEVVTTLKRNTKRNINELNRKIGELVFKDEEFKRCIEASTIDDD